MTMNRQAASCMVSDVRSSAHLKIGDCPYLKTRRDGYRARIAKGDVPLRDLRLAECHRRRLELGALDVPVWEDSVPVLRSQDVPALCRALTDEYRCVRRFAGAALIKMGPEAKEAVPSLISALRDENAVVRERSARALGRIGPAARQAVPALEEALTDKVERVREEARRALGKIRPPE